MEDKTSKLAMETLRLWVSLKGKGYVIDKMRLKTTDTIDRWLKQGRMPNYRVKQFMEIDKGEQR